MMKKQIAGILFATSIVAGVGAGVLANAVTSETPATASPGKTTGAPTADPTSPAEPTPTDEPADTPSSPSDLTIAHGALGPVSAGMSKAEALETGLFDADVEPPVDGCQAIPLAFKPAYADVVDVMTVGNGEITSLGVRGKGPTTKDGLGVGSTFAEVTATLEEGSDPVEAGYGQTGVFDYDAQTGRWIGYLFDAAPGDVKASDPVTFIEVTKGSQPGLMRDGC